MYYEVTGQPALGRSRGNHHLREPGRAPGVVGEIYVACTLKSATLNPGSHEPHFSLLQGGFGRPFL